MAAAVGNASTNHRYYCHQCEENISPTIPEFTCPECHLGFIEEVQNDDAMELGEGDNRLDHERQFAVMLRSLEPRRNEIHLGGPTRGRRLRMRERAGVNDSIGEPIAVLDQLMQLFSQGAAHSGVSVGESVDGLPGFLNFFHIHGHPGDYAWSGRGLDTIISRLLDQMEGSGPPPAEASQIASIPTVKISQSDIDASLECPVCQEVFILGEEVKRLTCKHNFHEMCIIPWLKKHDSCPVCRLSLNGTSNAGNDH